MYQSAPPSPRAGRTPNWFSAACGLVFVIAYLAMPFYTLNLFARTGMQLISGNALLILPALLGIAMIFGALLMPVVASIAISSVNLAMTLIMILFARYFAAVDPLSAGVVNATSWLGTQMNMDLTMYVISVSYGAVICLILCVVSIVLEVLLNRPAPVRPDGGQWAFDNRPGAGRGPGSHGGPGGTGGFKPF